MMSDILKAVHDTAKGLQDSGAISKTTMRKFDALCLTTIHEFTPEQVKSLRKKNNLSQPVFAQYLNVSDKLVKKWEQGESKPRGAALKMLSLAEKKGLEAIA
ncbi:DNA-binding transcriptional regulator [Psychrobium sp. MM17-31]|uniref:helix-turn-helix domain-containing protein n=1 Tax=Psychrobium sp. MM17-31 TaxID=2917758 RepID=UPI001EF56026|nr:DNA-binding transcriptional regulator [Psychrobium sp. MM17-31]MCG7530151.1 DNA-binding transcriptional regulator [Psychrobium sp. MM17-31]